MIKAGKDVLMVEFDVLDSTVQSAVGYLVAVSLLAKEVWDEKCSTQGADVLNQPIRISRNRDQSNTLNTAIENAIGNCNRTFEVTASFVNSTPDFMWKAVHGDHPTVKKKKSLNPLFDALENQLVTENDLLCVQNNGLGEVVQYLCDSWRNMATHK
ncbi:hypothetical protein FA15DRAFT_660746 [Coprinopsis marcescibilis]|uniref:Uncharacterized protein n=1 Tax=Coprinopsis marcescibilis TaxID=230819 RepID=A0A5C3KF51_COPMA|nr:hypothetical protein FA15DRAFT_660746 [Coprinopsis marcescibilis]